METGKCTLKMELRGGDGGYYFPHLFGLSREKYYRPFSMCVFAEADPTAHTYTEKLSSRLSITTAVCKFMFLKNISSCSLRTNSRDG